MPPHAHAKGDHPNLESKLEAGTAHAGIPSTGATTTC
jgi:hypothetical protein